MDALDGKKKGRMPKHLALPSPTSMSKLQRTFALQYTKSHVLTITSRVISTSISSLLKFNVTTVLQCVIYLTTDDIYIITINLLYNR